MHPQRDNERLATDAPGLLSRAAADGRSDRARLASLAARAFPAEADEWSEEQVTATRTRLITIAASLLRALAGAGGDSEGALARLSDDPALADPELIAFASTEALLSVLGEQLRSRAGQTLVPPRAAALTEHADAGIADAALAWLTADMGAAQADRAYGQLPARLLHRLAGIVAARIPPATIAGLDRLLADHDESRTAAVARRRLAHMLAATGEAPVMLADGPAAIGLPLWFALLAQTSGLDLGAIVRAAALKDWQRIAVMLRAAGVAAEPAGAALLALAGPGRAASLPSLADQRAMSRDGARNLVARWRIEARIGRPLGEGAA